MSRTMTNWLQTNLIGVSCRRRFPSIKNGRKRCCSSWTAATVVFGSLPPFSISAVQRPKPLSINVGTWGIPTVCVRTALTWHRCCCPFGKMTRCGTATSCGRFSGCFRTLGALFWKTNTAACFCIGNTVSVTR